MLAYAAGDASAFTRLYDHHERPVYRYFRRQGVASHQADDLLQETWMAVLRSAQRYRVEARFTTLLYLVVHRKLIDHWRATKQQVLLDDAANDPDGELTMEQMASVTAVGVETLKSRLRYAMKRVRLACADWLAPPKSRSGSALAGERDAV